MPWHAVVQDTATLTALERRIAEHMQGGKAYFCRLSTRSPKDGGAKIKAAPAAPAADGKQQQSQGDEMKLGELKHLVRLRA